MMNEKKLITSWFSFIMISAVICVIIALAILVMVGIFS